MALIRVPGVGAERLHFFARPASVPTPAALSGTAKDVNGNVVAGALIDVFESALSPNFPRRYVTSTVADALGRYYVGVPTVINLQVMAYLPGAPDIAGVTVNTLVGA